MARNIRYPYREEFDHYLSIEELNSIADEPRWTISDDNKVPLDAYETLYGSHTVRGAKYPDERCLINRHDLLEHYPNALNHTLYVKTSSYEPFIVLDIEAHCPKQKQTELLNNLPWFYAERSSSGQGLHLLLPTPWDTPTRPGFMRELYPNEEAYTQAATPMWFDLIARTALREESGAYEILTQHYVTFTFINDVFNKPPVPTKEKYKYFEAMLKDLIENAPSPTRSHTFVTPTGMTKSLNVPVERPQDTRYQEIANVAMSNYRRKPYKRTLEEFSNDASRWEFGVINSVISHVEIACINVLKVNSGVHEQPPIDEQTFVWLTYELAKEIIPHRDKHDGYRENMPYLLYRVRAAFMSRAEDIDQRIFAHDTTSQDTAS